MSSEIFKGLAVLMIVIIVYFYLSVTISTFWTNTVASKNTTPQEEPGETITEPVPTLSTPNVDITRNAIDAYTRSLPKP
jgi:flagellar basal body-associated protein FliL